jgi:hypothetical protein
MKDCIAVSVGRRSESIASIPTKMTALQAYLYQPFSPIKTANLDSSNKFFKKQLESLTLESH